MEGLPAVAPMGGRKGCLDGGLVWHRWEVPGLDTCPSHLPRTVRGTQGPDFATQEAKRQESRLPRMSLSGHLPPGRGRKESEEARQGG